MLFPTTLVGSYPQPEWLIDRKKLAGRFPPRVRARELWRVEKDFLEEAQNDATVLAIQAQEQAGAGTLKRGENRGERSFHPFAPAPEGPHRDQPAPAPHPPGPPHPPA